MAARVSQLEAEAVDAGIGAARATQLVPEAVDAGPGAARATQLVPEAVDAGSGAARATQLVPEAVDAGPGAARATQLVPEAVDAGRGAVHATQLIAEIVIQEMVGPSADVIWPATLLVPADAKLSPLVANSSGGQAFGGSEQIVGNTPGRWKLELNNIYLSSAAQIGAWHQVEGALNGRANTVLVPIYDYPRAPWPVVRGKQITTGSPIAAFVTADVPVGAVTASIEVQVGSELQGYEHFGFNQKVYRLTTILSVDTGGAYPIYSVKFKLPCRALIPSGSAIDFNDPMLRCRLDTDDAMAIKGGIELWRRAAPSLTLYEDVNS